MKITLEPKEIKWGIPFLKRIDLRYLVLLIFFFCSSSFVKAQELPNKMWHPGLVVTNEGDTLRGNLKYEFKNNIVQLAHEEGKLKAFSAQQLLLISFHCQFFKRFRYFYALPYNVGGGAIKTPILFEILVEGPITLMSREYVVLNNNFNDFNSPFSRSSYRGNRNATYELTYEYFFLTDNGDIVRYNKKKRELLQFFGQYKKQVESYMKDNRLKSDRQIDIIKATEFYNNLVNPPKYE